MRSCSMSFYTWINISLEKILVWLIDFTIGKHRAREIKRFIQDVKKQGAYEG